MRGYMARYGVEKGLLPQQTPSMQFPEWFVNPNMDYKQHSGLNKNTRGADLFRMGGQMLPHAAGAALTGGSSLPYTMAAESMGKGEGPIAPFLAGKITKILQEQFAHVAQTHGANQVARYIEKDKNILANLSTNISTSRR